MDPNRCQASFCRQATQTVCYTVAEIAGQQGMPELSLPKILEYTTNKQIYILVLLLSMHDLLRLLWKV